jgi:hypothetical protein
MDRVGYLLAALQYPSTTVLDLPYGLAVPDSPNCP